MPNELAVPDVPGQLFIPQIGEPDHGRRNENRIQDRSETNQPNQGTAGNGPASAGAHGSGVLPDRVLRGAPRQERAQGQQGLHHRDCGHGREVGGVRQAGSQIGYRSGRSCSRYPKIRRNRKTRQAERLLSRSSNRSVRGALADRCNGSERATERLTVVLLYCRAMRRARLAEGRLAGPVETGGGAASGTPQVIRGAK